MPQKFKNMTGLRFGALVIVAKAKSVRRGARWVYRCDCGNCGEADGGSLRRGTSRSCGCIREINRLKAITTHGHSVGKKPTRTFRSWESALARCYNQNHHKYPEYGGVGVKVCDRWRHSFENFLADMGGRPEGHSLDRYPDKNGDYTPENCRWATPIQQNNNRVTQRLIEYRGKLMTIAEAAALAGVVKQQVAWKRIDRGWPIRRALETPLLR